MGSIKIQWHPVQPRNLNVSEVVWNNESVPENAWATVEELRQTGQFIER
jgi:hypothetical protein